MKLYQSSASPNSRRVRIYLAEKGITMPFVPVDLASSEQFSDAYAAINPRRVVPALMLDDGTTIAEVPVIIRYLEELHPIPPLLGGSPQEKATAFRQIRLRAGQQDFLGRNFQPLVEIVGCRGPIGSCCDRPVQRQQAPISRYVGRRPLRRKMLENDTRPMFLS